jgi:hypothetical protein
MRPPFPGILFPNFIGSKLIKSFLFFKVKKKFKLFNFKIQKNWIFFAQDAGMLEFKLGWPIRQRSIRRR